MTDQQTDITVDNAYDVYLEQVAQREKHEANCAISAEFLVACAKVMQETTPTEGDGFSERVPNAAYLMFMHAAQEFQKHKPTPLAFSVLSWAIAMEESGEDEDSADQSVSENG